MTSEQSTEVKNEPKKKRSKIISALLLLVGLGLVVYEYGNYNMQKAEEKNHKKPVELVAHPLQMEFLVRLPTRALSYFWGKLVHMELPLSFREPLYKLYAKTYNCNLNEMEEPDLKKYKCLAEFFCRRLKPSARPLSEGLVSPVDGTVLHFGQIHADELEQVKGISYSLSALLGKNSLIEEAQRQQEAIGEDSKHKFYHCIIYLGPGDYHGIHAPTDINFVNRRHLPGYLFPVRPSWVSFVRGLFALNERVALTGVWDYGWFCMVPVGATNVGSIVVNFDKEFTTNQWSKPKEPFYEKNFPGKGVAIKKGEEVAFFHMGSTVVLLFQSPDFDFSIQAGQKIKLGESMGKFTKK